MFHSTFCLSHNSFSHSPIPQIKCLKGSHRIEIHVYAPEWITLMTECTTGEEEAELDAAIDPLSLTSMATQLLIMISKHIQTLASDWFLGTYIPM